MTAVAPAGLITKLTGAAAIDHLTRWQEEAQWQSMCLMIRTLAIGSCD
jgi:hypothetical protein